MSATSRDKKKKRRIDQMFFYNGLWLANPNEFNDPMDCRPHFDFNLSDNQAIETFHRKTIVVAAQKKGAINTLEWNRQAELLLSQYPAVDDAFLQFAQGEVQSSIRDNVAVLCLSEVRNDPVMFYHYGDQHRGVCLEFRVDDFLSEANQVTYSEEYPVVDYFATNNEGEEYKQIFLTKYKGWDYEKEWRIVDTQNSAHLEYYPKQLLESVTFGYKMNNHAKRKIKELLRNRGHKVKIFEAKVSAKSYFLDIIPCGEVNPKT